MRFIDKVIDWCLPWFLLFLMIVAIGTVSFIAYNLHKGPPVEPKHAFIGFIWLKGTDKPLVEVRTYKDKEACVEKGKEHAKHYQMFSESAAKDIIVISASCVEITKDQ
jgi:hypothetical protein